MSMFGPKMGTWCVSCRSDPRWNNGGRAYGLCCSGGPEEMRKWIEECKQKYGKAPEDATMEFMKD